MQNNRSERQAADYPKRQPILCSCILISGSNVCPGTAAELQEFLEACWQARSDNVTGLMHHERGLWVQYVEGTAAAIQGLCARARRSWRHRSMAQRICTPPRTRRFDDFTMPGLYHPTPTFDAYQSERSRAVTSLSDAPSCDLLAFLLFLSRSCDGRSFGADAGHASGPCRPSRGAVAGPIRGEADDRAH